MKHKLSLNKEYKLVKRKIRSSTYRDNIKLEVSPGTSVSELQELLIEFKPDILHFSGHGTKLSTLIFQSDVDKPEEAPKDAFTDVFRIIRGNTRCVVLNACYTEELSDAIVRYIDCAVGTSSAIKDEQSQAFSSGFYMSIAEGMSLKEAFETGRNQLELLKGRTDIVHLKTCAGIDAGHIFLVEKTKDVLDEILRLYLTSLFEDKQYSLLDQAGDVRHVRIKLPKVFIDLNVKLYEKQYSSLPKSNIFAKIEANLPFIDTPISTQIKIAQPSIFDRIRSTFKIAIDRISTFTMTEKLSQLYSTLRKLQLDTDSSKKQIKLIEESYNLDSED